MTEAAASTGRRTAEFLCGQFLDALPVTGVSIAVFGESGRQSTIGATDRLSVRLDELQFELGEGPYSAVARTATPVLIPDVRAADHHDWPIFGAAVRDLDVGALFAMPLVMGAVTVGVVGMYRTAPGELDQRAIARASSLAFSAATSAVMLAVRSADNDNPAESAVAPAMRREVHQATGMIVAQLDTSATEAFARLTAHAFSNGRSVQEVAHDIVNRKLDFSRLVE